MKKTSSKPSLSVKNVLIASVVLLVVIVAWRMIGLRSNAAGSHPLSLADNRHVENVQCSGACESAMLVDSQQSGQQYFVGIKCSTCNQAILWGNKNGREDQIIFGGYAIIDGVQKNLQTQSFGSEVLDGRNIDFTVVENGSTYIAHLKNTGEWNLLDSMECGQPACDETFAIFTDRDAGRATLYGTCPTESASAKVYSLYQAPEVHGPDASDTYLVGISLGALPSTGSTTGSVAGVGFEHTYSSSELANNSIHVTADVGDVTFDFDLVKDAK